MERQIAGRILEVLLVEDNPADARLAAEAWRDVEVPHRVSVVQNGEQALAFLRRTSPFETAPRPDVMLLDLNLPRKDGREVLTEMKADPELRRVPVIILTTSDRHLDIMRSYDLQANCYVVKPVGLDESLGALRAIADFWFVVPALPSGTR